ncbi:MAG TPA: 1-deoxy-D-xylulose-5-phosphate synthase [Acidimicrobiales bacterium]|nr:1-deoxy-D-xylulose-5-phosphate synthase [Acidimicrobiales bacterium]
MLLDTISSPADLRRLDHEALDRLAGEIREFIINAVSLTGGHLGSNLGAVELTLALHRVFDSPRDILLWDTGHQAYVHKIVTGRREGFATLRQGGGLSGYPSRDESEHDWVENSHASTILSYAHGMATAIEHEGLDRRVVAVIGDGSMTGGMAFEGLNNLGMTGRRAVIVLNDNGRSYAPTHSKLGESLARLRLDPRYTRQRARLERFLGAIPVIGERLQRSLESATAAVREMWEPPAFFEQLGVRYTGPFDGHDIAGLESALRNAAEWDGPIVVHVLTEKGKGYPFAEDDDEQRGHDAPRFDPLTGPSPKDRPSGYTGAFSDALVAAGASDPKVMAITAAMPGSTGLLPFQARFPDRFLDVGIAEQHAVTAAAGMAMLGLRPVVAIYSTFLTRAIDQVIYDVGLHHQPVVFAIDRAGITGDNGASHHGVLDLALATKVPGMTVFAPSSAQEIPVMLAEALSITSGPSLLRWPNGAAREVPPDQVGAGLRARKAVDGGDAAEVAILAVGKMVAAAEEAAGLLADNGTVATVWDVRVAKPLDAEMIDDAAGHRLVVTVEDGIRVGGVGSQVADALADLNESRTAPPVLVLGTPAEFIDHGSVARIHADLGLDAAGIAAATTKALTAARDPLAD